MMVPGQMQVWPIDGVPHCIARGATILPTILPTLVVKGTILTFVRVGLTGCRMVKI